MQVFLNGFHTPFQDTFWVSVTAMGGTVFCLCVLLAGSLFSYRYMVSGIVSILCTMALVALLKHAFDAPRPLTVLTQAGVWDSIVLVEGHPLRDTLSFPSGHTAAAFSLFTTLALFATRAWVKTLLFLGGPGRSVQPHLSDATFPLRRVGRFVSRYGHLGSRVPVGEESPLDRLRPSARFAASLWPTGKSRMTAFTALAESLFNLAME